MVSQVVEPADGPSQGLFFEFGRSWQTTAVFWSLGSTFAGTPVNGDLDCMVTRSGGCGVK